MQRAKAILHSCWLDKGIASKSTLVSYAHIAAADGADMLLVQVLRLDPARFGWLTMGPGNVLPHGAVPVGLEEDDQEMYAALLPR